MGESNDSDKQDKSIQSTGMNRLMKRLGLKGGSHDSALGMSNSEGNSSLGSFDGNMTPELPKPKTITVAGVGRRRPILISLSSAQQPPKCPKRVLKLKTETLTKQ